MASGDIIIAVKKPAAPQTSEEVIEDTTGDEAGNRNAANDTPEGVNTKEESTEKNKVEDIICELTEFSAKCSHEDKGKRIVTMTNKSAGIIILEVVASETYKKDFEKITATIKGNALCGEHIANSSTISPAPVSVTKNASSNIYTLACKPFSSPLQNIWLPSVKPTSYKLHPNAHQSFNPSAIKIDVYPKIKWNGELGYSFGAKESKRADNKIEHKNTVSKYTGKLELEYNGEKRDFAPEFNDSIETILTKLDWITQKVDGVLSYFDGGESITLTVDWPNIKITYTTELKEEEKTRAVINPYNLTIGAAPLIKIKGGVNFFPILMKTLSVVVK